VTQAAERLQTVVQQHQSALFGNRPTSLHKFQTSHQLSLQVLSQLAFVLVLMLLL
jgi:hypothetical protein